jgi:dienelactone hydrolase
MRNESTDFSAHPPPDLSALNAFFGPLPPQAEPCRTDLAHQWVGDSHRLSVWQISVGNPVWVSWLMYRAAPLGTEASATLLSPDACWPHVIDASAINALLGQNLALAWFDRLHVAWDGPDAVRGGPLHQHWPDQAWSAIAAWAWGIRMCVTALLQTLPGQTVGVIGHSRGGKAALLAAACDPRIQAVISHNSGTGGLGHLQITPLGAETLADLAAKYPHWLAESVQDPAVQRALIEANAPAQWLKAIAPRGLCVLQADDDLWANPLGTQEMVRQIAPAWQAASTRLQLHQRHGGHRMTPLDWQRAAQFLGDLSDAHAGQAHHLDKA